ncbi:MAG: FmdB family zinc ribbon protein [Chloroflexota bacterium]
MPVYEYRCPDCANLFEKLVRLSEADRQVDCPTCGARAGKLLSTFAAIGQGGDGMEAVGAPVGGGGCCGGGCCGGG